MCALVKATGERVVNEPGVENWVQDPVDCVMYYPITNGRLVNRSRLRVRDRKRFIGAVLIRPTGQIGTKIKQIVFDVALKGRHVRFTSLGSPKLCPTGKQIIRARNGGIDMINAAHDAPIIQRLYLFYRSAYLVIEKMPKKDKYALGERTQKITLDVLELLIAASYFPKEKKLACLQQATMKLDLLKLLLRLANEVKAMPSKNYLELSESLNEIGKMLGGWLRSVR